MSWRAEDIHNSVDWRAILPALGVDVAFLRNRHGPCPIHGGQRPFRFDDQRARGTWICSSCGAGDGFKLLMRVNNWTFVEARARVLEAMGQAAREPYRPVRPAPRQVTQDAQAQPSRRVTEVLHTSCAVDVCADAIGYLQSRAIWPLPPGCALRAHAQLDYWDETTSPAGEAKHVHVGKFSGLVAPVRDIDGELVTAHLTYLRDGKKLEGHSPRKILGSLRGRRGATVRLVPLAGDVLGIAEGLETALAAIALHGVPTWSALNAGLLGKFEPPPHVHHVIAFCDADRAGYEAWDRLREQLDGRCTTERRTPPAPHNDWADVLAARSAQT